MKGRKPIPQNVYELKGSRGRRARSDQKSAGVAGMPECPKWLSTRATELWHSATVWLFEDIQVLTRGDQSVLALYCDAVADYESIVYRLRETGRVYTSENVTEVERRDGTTVRQRSGMQIKTHPLVAQQNELRRRIQSLAAELGLSPVARLRAAQAAGGDTTRDGIGGFLGRT